MSNSIEKEIQQQREDDYVRKYIHRYDNRIHRREYKTIFPLFLTTERTGIKAELCNAPVMDYRLLYNRIV